MNIVVLETTAQDIISKTILAADESTGTITKRLASIGLTSTPELNRQYRQMLFSAPQIEKYISGVILYDETLRQSTDDGTPFAAFLSGKGIVPGIKVDQGTSPLTDGSVDTMTKGLDGLRERLLEYRKLGARFAKWRAVFTITDDAPSRDAIERNTEDLAIYAKVCQDADIVPIVEPEVLMDGSHTIERDREVTGAALARLFAKLREHEVVLNGVVLKPNMITAGTKNQTQIPKDQVADETIATLLEFAPLEVPGIAFLSGGQSPELATEHLNLINKRKIADLAKYPWKITASYGRALQGEALEAWAGKPENVTKAQSVFIARAEKVYKAALGAL